MSFSKTSYVQMLLKDGTFKKHEFFKTSYVQMLLKDGTKRQKSGITDFQNIL